MDTPLNDEAIARLTDRLDDKDKDLEARIHKIEVALFGDAELRAKWEAGKLNYPSMAEPPRGLIAGVAATSKAMLEIGQIVHSYDERIAESTVLLKDTLERITGALDKKTAFVNRLEAFFGPMLANKNPPLDDAVIASKEFVTTAIDRISRVLREETVAATSLSKLFVQEVLILTGWDRHTTGAEARVLAAARRLVQLYGDFLQRDAADEERRSKPSRWQLLVSILTGQPPGSRSKPTSRIYAPTPGAW